MKQLFLGILIGMSITATISWADHSIWHIGDDSYWDAREEDRRLDRLERYDMGSDARRELKSYRSKQRFDSMFNDPC